MAVNPPKAFWSSPAWQAEPQALAYRTLKGFQLVRINVQGSFVARDTSCHRSTTQDQVHCSRSRSGINRHPRPDGFRFSLFAPAVELEGFATQQPSRCQHLGPLAERSTFQGGSYRVRTRTTANKYIREICGLSRCLSLTYPELRPRNQITQAIPVRPQRTESMSNWTAKPRWSSVLFCRGATAGIDSGPQLGFASGLKATTG